jgi:predicted phage replisome organizer
MGDVKWIKIAVDIFDDDKILLIEQMPEGYAIIVAWFKLLSLAGKKNNSGVFVINDKIPYTDEMFSTIFRMPLQVVRLALTTFERFGMVEIINDAVTIPKWGKHQSLDKIEKQTEYMAKYREKQRLLASGSKTNSKTNCKTNCKTNSNTNVSGTELELDKELEKKKSSGAAAPDHTKYGVYGWVRLTEDEHTRLLADLGEAELKRCIDYVDESAQKNGNKNKWKDWNLVIRHCNRDKWGMKNEGEEPVKWA